MAFVTFWLAKDARKVLSNIVSDGHGTVFSVAYPKEKPQASTAPWVGEYEELKLYVVGLPNLTTDTEVLVEFTKDGSCEVHMMQNTAFVNFGDKYNAARAIKRLHNKFMFPGSSRCISVRYARKKSYNAPSAKNPPSQKLSKVTWSFFVPHSSYNSTCVFYCTQATPAHMQLHQKSYNAPSAKNQPNQKLSKVTWSFYLLHSSLQFILCFLLHTGKSCTRATTSKIDQRPQRKKSNKPKAIEGNMPLY